MLKITLSYQYKDLIFYSSKPRQNRRHLADDIFKCIFLKENVLISIKI